VECDDLIDINDAVASIDPDGLYCTVFSANKSYKLRL
jgi:hypothetical protein